MEVSLDELMEKEYEAELDASFEYAGSFALAIRDTIPVDKAFQGVR